MGKVVNTRLLVLETLLEAEKKNMFVKDSLNRTLIQNQFLDKKDRAFISRMVEGITEYQIRLDYVIDYFSKTKVRKCKPVIRMILRMGVYQMLYMDSVPNEVACDECVKLARKKGFHNLTGFVNGVLRTISGNLNSIVYPDKNREWIDYLSVEYSVPKWLAKKVTKWYGNKLSERILEAALKTQDLTIRVNSNRISKEELVKKLRENGMIVKDGIYVPEALHLENINYVRKLPGFLQGEFFVQDESSMLLYHVAKPFLTDRADGNMSEKLQILDLCAAPGGKSTHFAQMLGEQCRIYAADISLEKVALIDENIQRLQLHNVETAVQDATVLHEDFVGKADVVIADLPCSGLGILSKKNDIKYHLQEEQLEELSALQRTILQNAALYLKKDGLLIYSTCTINPEENIRNAQWFMEHFDYRKVSVKDCIPKALETCVVDDNMVQLLPGREQCDGFFIAAFQRN